MLASRPDEEMPRLSLPEFDPGPPTLMVIGTRVAGVVAVWVDSSIYQTRRLIVSANKEFPTRSGNSVPR